MKAFQAYAGKHTRAYGETPRDAAREFFKVNPGARKCDLIEGTRGDGFFTVSFGRASVGEWPRSYKGVTPKSAETLPTEGAEE